MAGRLGCAERETIADAVLRSLANTDDWQTWIPRSDYPTGSNCDWEHAHWAGEYYTCSFDDWVRYSDDQQRFQVTNDFIDRVMMTLKGM